MIEKIKKIKQSKPWLYNIGLVILGAIIFSISFPGMVSNWGLGFFAWFALIPVFLLIRRISLRTSPLYGFAYGYVSYTIFNFWLASFNPTSFIAVPIIYGSHLFFWFFFIKWADKTFPKWGYLGQVFMWLAYEIYRLKGYLGYSYGVMGYSQYKFLNFIGISDITGVIGVSAMLVFSSAWIARILICREEEGLSIKEILKQNFIKIPGIIFAVLFVASIIYSVNAKVDYSESPTLRASLVQHNVDSWLSGTEVYAQALEKLLELSDEALEDDPDVVVWSETAFVPSIQWHDKMRRDRTRYKMVAEIQDYLKTTDVPFLIGNNDTMERAGETISYNAVLKMQDGEVKNTYHKIHLVPFGEHFPFENIFPFFYDYIVSTGAAMYEKGDTYKTFDIGEFKVSPQICFEDTFGYLSRNFVRAGGQVLVNLTNDSWSPSPACSIQHGSIAVFRAVENRRSMVRSSNGGLTVMISPNGEILEYLDPFIADVLTVDIPVYDETETFFTRTPLIFDHIVEYGAIVLGLVMLIMSIMNFLKSKREKGL